MLIKINLFGIETVTYVKTLNLLKVKFNSGLICAYKQVPENIFLQFVDEFHKNEKKGHILNYYKKLLNNFELELLDY